MRERSFSVVVCTDGRAPFLKSALQSLRALDYCAFEVCVVCGPTDDGAGEFAKALENYRRTLAAEPDDFEATIQAGNSARHAGDARTAAALFARAGQLRPDSWIPIYNQACLAAVQGDAAKSLGLLQVLRGKRFPRADLMQNDSDLAAVRCLPGYAPLHAELAAKNAGADPDDEGT